MAGWLSDKGRAVGFAVVIACAGLLGVSLIDQHFFSRIKDEREKLLRFEALELKFKLESYLDTRFSVLTAIASLYETEGRVSNQRFKAFSSKLYKEIGGFRSLQYADPDSVVAVSYPERERSPVGHRLLETDFTRPFVLRAIQTKKMTVNDPYGLITTRKSGFIARKPVFREGKYHGLAIGVFEVAHLVDAVFTESVLGRFDFRLVDSKDSSFYSSIDQFPQRFIRELIEVGDNFWYLDLVAKHMDESDTALLRGVIWILGAISAMLLAGLTYFREERRRQAERATIYQAENLASVGRLAAGVAHEILNPLNIISMMAQRTLLDGREPEEVRDKARRTLTQVERVTKIVHSLKRMARQSSHTLEDVDVESLVDSALALVTHEVRTYGIEVQRDLQALAPIRADYDELTRVLVNLFTNAIEAMESKEVKRLIVRAETITRRGGPWLKLQVTDTGEGIAREDIQRVFEPFFSKKQAKGGTGLGLSLSRSIIEEHGGEMEVQSQEGMGTTFTLYLPSMAPQPSLV